MTGLIKLKTIKKLCALSISGVIKEHLVFLSIFLVVLLVLPGCSKKIHRVSKPLLGTMVNLTVIGDDNTAAMASQAAFREIERIENLMSPYRKGSDIMKIRYAKGSMVKIGNETWLLVERSKVISEKTGGAFDISFASLSGLWNFKAKNFRPPSLQKISAVLRLVNYRRIKLYPEDKIRVPAGMRIGLGGIAKGYAIKRAAVILQKNGISDAIVEEGGDLQVIGTKFGRLWKTGVMHPRHRTLMAVIEMKGGEAIATSGDYERFKTYKGKRYHHIIDPRTGYPAKGFISVSVLSRDPVLSDALATAFSVMKLKAIKDFLKMHNDLGVILVDKNMKIYITGNIKKRLTLADQISVKWL